MPPQPDSCDPCCGFISLKIASLVVGYLQLLGVIGFTIWMICRIVGVSAELTELGAGVIMSYSIFMYLLFILFVFIVVLLTGIHLQKRGWVKAYLTAFVIFMGLAVIVFALYTKYKFTPEVFYPGLVGFVLSAYFFGVIVSCYREMGVYRSRY